MLKNTANQFFIFCILGLFAFALPSFAQDDGEVLIDKAYISRVTVNDDLTVDIVGELGDACTELGEVEQVVEGNTVTINVMTTRPADLMCAMQLQTFETTVTVDVSGLAPGEYTLNVNGTETEITIPEAGAEAAPSACDELEADDEQAKFENEQFCFLYPETYSANSNDTLTLLTSRQRVNGQRVTLLIEVLDVDDTITSLEELEIIVADTYSEQELEFEAAEIGGLDALLTDSITMRSGASRHLYILWDDENLVILELQPLNEATEDAVDELWTLVTESWAFID
jgi:hypothetical protein